MKIKLTFLIVYPLVFGFVGGLAYYNQTFTIMLFFSMPLSAYHGYLTAKIYKKLKEK